MNTIPTIFNERKVPHTIVGGTVKKSDEDQSPFTVIHPQGIRGVFSPAEINEILELTERLAA